LFEWEVGEANQLINLLNDKSLTKDTGNCWVADKNLGYMVSSTYKCLRTKEEGDFRSMYEFFWSIKVLTSCMTTAWKVMTD